MTMAKEKPLYLTDIMALPQQTDVVGDLDLFMHYLDSGQAALDWEGRMVEQRELFDRFMRAQDRGLAGGGLAGGENGTPPYDASLDWEGEEHAQRTS